jgi:hypothetical protein
VVFQPWQLSVLLLTVKIVVKKKERQTVNLQNDACLGDDGWSPEHRLTSPMIEEQGNHVAS